MGDLRRYARGKLLLAIVLLAGFKAFGGQVPTVTLSAKNASLEKILAAIKRQTGLDYFYSSDIKEYANKININVTNVPVTEALDICFREQPQLTYKIIENVVVIALKFRGHVKAGPEKGPAAGLIAVTGRITNENSEPVPGASIAVINSKKLTLSNEEGAFNFDGLAENAQLVISCIGYEQKEVHLNASRTIFVQLKVDPGELRTVTVLATGYQDISPGRTTGSFVRIGNELLNRSVSTNILDRLNGVSSGVLFHSEASGLGFSIRGRSTLFANTSPLVILDNFPYDGNLNTINPNDIESITILKDAAASSIWGVRAGNGVIVLKTKRGVYGRPLQIAVNSSITFGEKPDIYRLPELSSKEVIQLEASLFANGVYDGRIDAGRDPVSPVVEILMAKRNGQLSEEAAEEQLSALAKTNNKDDLSNYYYRGAVNQQHSFRISGGGNHHKFYFSAGYDRNLQNVQTDINNRLTVNAGHSYRFLKDKMEISTGLIFSAGRVKTGLGQTYLDRPYISLKDKDGATTQVYPYRREWIDTIASGKLLDWRLRPLEEINSIINKSDVTNYLLDVKAKYDISNSINVNLLYQYARGVTEANILYPVNSFYTRNLINRFSQVDYSTGAVTRPIPVGDILSTAYLSYATHNVRAQINYNKNWGAKHAISALAGWEVKDYRYKSNSNIYYGCNGSVPTMAPPDLSIDYPLIFAPGVGSRIPGAPQPYTAIDRYISWFANFSYTYKRLYTVSGSARRDASNLFGVDANKKGVPLWSVGAAWNVNNASFYKLAWLPDLKLRLTYGYSGNVDKSVSAYATAQPSAIRNPFGEPAIVLVNPPNPDLGWEKIGMLNAGIDFSLFKRRLTGTIEYYQKNGKDIIGNSPLAPQTGATSFRGNTANISGKGWDITIVTTNLKGKLTWNTTILYSYNIDKITNYKVKTTSLGFRQGYPFGAIFSYRYAGLDNNGDPQGFMYGQPSKSWAAVMNMDIVGANTVYNGPGMPVSFGSIRNTFSWKNLRFSFNILYKGGYYFRRNTIDYSTLFTHFTAVHSDYLLRWRKPGDEQSTTVPSLVYPSDPARDKFYAGSEALVEKGDHIRLQDLQLSYDFDKQKKSSLPFQKARLYVYANNIAVLWVANKKDIDPDHPMLPAQRTIAFGIQLDF